LIQNKKEVGKGKVPRSNPVAYAPSEGLEIGSDSTIPTWLGYALLDYVPKAGGK
jgi:hypothetical protein